MNIISRKIAMLIKAFFTENLSKADFYYTVHFISSLYGLRVHISLRSRNLISSQKYHAYRFESVGSHCIKLHWLLLLLFLIATSSESCVLATGTWTRLWAMMSVSTRVTALILATTTIPGSFFCNV